LTSFLHYAWTPRSHSAPKSLYFSNLHEVFYARFTAIRLVDNNRTWTAIHSLAMLAYEGGFVDGVLIPQDKQIADTSELFTAISSEMPENPTIILSAIGLLLYLIRNRKR